MIVEAVKKRLLANASAMPASGRRCFSASFWYSAAAASARGRL